MVGAPYDPYGQNEVPINHPDVPVMFLSNGTILKFNFILRSPQLQTFDFHFMLLSLKSTETQISFNEGMWYSHWHFASPLFC